MMVWQEYMMLFNSEEGMVTYGREKSMFRSEQ